MNDLISLASIALGNCKHQIFSHFWSASILILRSAHEWNMWYWCWPVASVVIELQYIQIIIYGVNEILLTVSPECSRIANAYDTRRYVQLCILDLEWVFSGLSKWFSQSFRWLIWVRVFSPGHKTSRKTADKLNEVASLRTILLIFTSNN